MDFAGSINYMISCISKIPRIITGLTYYTGGGIQRTINRLSDNNSSIDMTNCDTAVYDGLMVNYFCALVLAIISTILTSISGGVFGILLGGIGLIGQVIFMIASLVILAVVITIGRANTTHWNMTFIKVISVIYLLCVVITAVQVIGGIIGLVTDILHFHFMVVIISIVSLISDICGLLGIGMILNGLNGGRPFTNQPQFNNQQGFGQQGFGQQYNTPGFDQGFGQQGQASQGYGDFNQGFGQQQQEFQSHMNEQAQQQMYQCPYCGKPITSGINPCPYCGNILNW